MNNTIQFSSFYFFFIASISFFVFFIRTMPWSIGRGGLSSQKWIMWFADQIQTRLGIEPESFITRVSRLASVLIKYGVVAWAILNQEKISLHFVLLMWVLLLVIEVLRKAAQFYIPLKWENVSLKLDSEHFWLIHLVVLGVAELQLGGGKPYGLCSLILFYIMFAGESKPSLLSAIDDVVSCSWSIVALLFLLNYQIESLQNFIILLVFVLSLRGVVRVFTGRAWIRRRFWWVAQFCLMTSLIIKSLVVLNAFAFINS
ncbi:MAG: hypothetical protein K2P81_03980 [Bacteriovoracaceae bacterium]|nr:hypothetical protein [Bacteriovoracaceae bacterium]